MLGEGRVITLRAVVPALASAVRKDGQAWD